MTTSPIGFVGAGRMGTAIVTRLTAVGYSVLVADPSPDAQRRCAELGATIAASCREVASRCRVVIVVVNSDAQLLEALTGDEGLLSGATPGIDVIVHSTVHLETLRAATRAASEQGIVIVDAGVTGGDDAAVRGELAVLVGSDDVTFTRVRSTLSAYASHIVHTGGSGTGMAAKHAIQTVLMGKLAATYEGLLLAHRAGVEIERFTDVLQYAEDASGIHPFFLAARARAFAGNPDASWTQVCAHQLPIAQKDLDAALALGDELSLALPTTRAAREVTPEVWST